MTYHEFFIDGPRVPSEPEGNGQPGTPDAAYEGLREATAAASLPMGRITHLSNAAPVTQEDFFRAVRQLQSLEARRKRFAPYRNPAGPGYIGTLGGDVENKFQKWVTKQDTVWIDRIGRVFLIEKMDKEYALNVLLFLYESHSRKIDPPRSNPLVQALRRRVLSA